MLVPELCSAQSLISLIKLDINECRIASAPKRVFDVWMLCLIASGAQMLFLSPFKCTVVKAMGEEALIAIKHSQKKD